MNAQEELAELIKIASETPCIGSLRASLFLRKHGPAIAELIEAIAPFARYAVVEREMGGPRPKTGAFTAVHSSIAGSAELTIEDLERADTLFRKLTEPK